jgi:hypothetical protein
MSAIGGDDVPETQLTFPTPSMNIEMQYQQYNDNLR